MSMAPAGLIIALGGLEHGRQTEKQAMSDTLGNANALAEMQIRITESTRQLLSTLGALPAFRERRWDEVEAILKSVHAKNPEYLNFSVTDPAGMVLASSLLSKGTDLSGRPHVRKAIETETFSTGEYVVGLIESTPSFAYSYPFLDGDGRLIAVLNTLFKLSSYDLFLNALNPTKDAFMGIVDRNGIRLYVYPQGEASPLGQPVSDSIREKLFGPEKQGVFLGVGSDGDERFFGYRRLYLDGSSEAYMTVAYAKPRDAVVGPSKALNRRSFLLMAISAVVALAIALVLSQILFGRRLSRLSFMAASIEAGELGVRVGNPADRSDLGRIAMALDSMADAVRKRDQELVEDARRLALSLEDKEVLLKEVHHRVKNNLQLILSLVRLQSGASVIPEPARKELEGKISAMTLVHEMLYRGEVFSGIEIGLYCANLVHLIQGFTDCARIRTDIDASELRWKLDKAIPFGLLVNELVTNAVKHGPETNSGTKERDGAEVHVRLSTAGGMTTLRVSDNGPGLPEGFTLSDSKGMGLKLADALANQLDGTLSWENDGGAHFIAVFPS